MIKHSNGISRRVQNGMSLKNMLILLKHYILFPCDKNYKITNIEILHYITHNIIHIFKYILQNFKVLINLIKLIQN